MVKGKIGSLGWLCKRTEGADTDLLREMVKDVVGVFMSTQASAVCGVPYRQPKGAGSSGDTVRNSPASSVIEYFVPRILYVPESRTFCAWVNP